MRSANLPPSGSFLLRPPTPPAPSFLALPPIHPSSGSDQCILVSTVFFFSCPDPAAVGSASGVLAAATTTALARRQLRGWCRWRRGVRGREAVAAAMGNVRVSVCGRGVLSEAAEGFLRQVLVHASGGRKAIRWPHLVSSLFV
jgi:hypothetical protein